MKRVSGAGELYKRNNPFRIGMTLPSGFLETIVDEDKKWKQIWQMKGLHIPWSIWWVGGKAFYCNIYYTIYVYGHAFLYFIVIIRTVTVFHWRKKSLLRFLFFNSKYRKFKSKSLIWRCQLLFFNGIDCPSEEKRGTWLFWSCFWDSFQVQRAGGVSLSSEMSLHIYSHHKSSSFSLPLAPWADFLFFNLYPKTVSKFTCPEPAAFPSIKE